MHFRNETLIIHIPCTNYTFTCIIISIYSSSYLFIIFPNSTISTSIFKCYMSFSVFFSMQEMAVILFAASKLIKTLSMKLIFWKDSLVFSSIIPFNVTHTVHFSVLPITFISILTSYIFTVSLSLPHIKVSIKIVTILVLNMTISMSHTIYPISLMWPLTMELVKSTSSMRSITLSLSLIITILKL